jgi:hypothetical protein
MNKSKGLGHAPEKEKNYGRRNKKHTSNYVNTGI